MRSVAFLLMFLAGAAVAEMAPRAFENPPADITTDSARGVYFGRDSMTLDATDLALIARQAEVLRADPTLSVMLRGYVEDTSSAAYGLAVAQRRLELVRMALLSVGVSPRRVKTEIHAGDLADATNCAEDDCQNRWQGVDMYLRH